MRSASFLSALKSIPTNRRSRDSDSHLTKCQSSRNALRNSCIALASFQFLSEWVVASSSKAFLSTQVNLAFSSRLISRFAISQLVIAITRTQAITTNPDSVLFIGNPEFASIENEESTSDSKAFPCTLDDDAKNEKVRSF